MPNEAEDRWTIRRLLAWTTDFLGKRGSDSPRLDAEVLLAHSLDWQRVKLYTHHEEEVGDDARSKFRELVRRRSDGTPVAYLVGRKEFYSLTFKVSPAVLIPRPDSEFVVVEFLDRTKGKGPIRAVDVGTGSGCLALACAAHNPDAAFTAIDLSPDALAIASENAASLGLTDRVSFRLGSLLEPVAEEGPFDVILSNPPYIKSAEIPRLDRDVRCHEPHLALDGGDDGLAVVRPLIAAATPLLRPGGHLILEIGSDQEVEVRGLFEGLAEYRLAPTIRDLANHPRVIRATRSG